MGIAGLKACAMLYIVYERISYSAEGYKAVSNDPLVCSEPGSVSPCGAEHTSH